MIETKVPDARVPRGVRGAGRSAPGACSALGRRPGRLLGVHHRDRAGGALEHPLADRAENQPLEASPSARPDDEKPCVAGVFEQLHHRVTADRALVDVDLRVLLTPAGERLGQQRLLLRGDLGPVTGPRFPERSPPPAAPTTTSAPRAAGCPSRRRARTRSRPPARTPPTRPPRRPPARRPAVAGPGCAGRSPPGSGRAAPAAGRPSPAGQRVWRRGPRDPTTRVPATREAATRLLSANPSTLCGTTCTSGATAESSSTAVTRTRSSSAGRSGVPSCRPGLSTTSVSRAWMTCSGSWVRRAFSAAQRSASRLVG